MHLPCDALHSLRILQVLMDQRAQFAAAGKMVGIVVAYEQQAAHDHSMPTVPTVQNTTAWLQSDAFYSATRTAREVCGIVCWLLGHVCVFIQHIVA